MSTTTQQTYQPNGESEFTADALLPCPFCGGKAELMFKGGSWSTKRTAIAYCRKVNCRARIEMSTIKHVIDQIADAVIKAWNKRKAAT